jgi:hypothetical protein
MQPTAGLACERRFLARGAAAGSGAAAWVGPIGAKAPWNTLFKVAIRHVEISASFGVLLYPIIGGSARVEWLFNLAKGESCTVHLGLVLFDNPAAVKIITMSPDTRCSDKTCYSCRYMDGKPKNLFDM